MKTFKEITSNPVDESNYAKPTNKTEHQLYKMLKKVYDDYPEYQPGEYGGEGFEAMVKLFAKDKFYNMHFVAKEYIKSPYFGKRK